MAGVRLAGETAEHSTPSERRRVLGLLASLPAMPLATVSAAAGPQPAAGAASAASASARDGAAAHTSASGGRLRRVRLGIRFVTTRDGADHERGRETVEYDFHPDGLVVVRIHSESDSPRVVRDAIYTLDAQWRPVDCLLRLQTDGRFEGSGWFRFETDVAYCEGWNARDGRIEQRVPLATPVTAFVAHPVATDVMLAASYDHSRETRRQRLRGVFMSSADPYGRTGPMLAPSDVWLDYAGRESLQTPAGTRDADHYVLYLRDGEGPAKEPLQDLWCLAGTAVFLRAEARGEYRTRYELTRFETE